MNREVSSMDRAGEAAGRSNVYSLLGRFYLKEATRKLIDTVKEDNVLSVLRELGADVDGMFPEGDMDALIEALSEEYASLFIVPGGFSPYESVWLKGMLAQEPEWEVRQFYRRCGLEVKDDDNPDNRIFSDHIGLELDFMGYLARKESAAWGKNDEKDALRWRDLQAEFFSSHIDKWAFKLLDNLLKYTTHPFYREVFALTKRFLELEKGDLA